MKIIDLLVKISKGEEVPKKIVYNSRIFRYNEYNKCYIWNCNGDEFYLSTYYRLENILNDEVEPIEPKEIEFEKFTSFIANVGRVDETNIEEYIHTLFSQQMRLIENQKKIIDVINDMRDKEC